MNFPMKNIYKTAISLIKKLNSHDHQAYLVGGCVRDLILGRDISDYDIATSALPEEIIEVFGSENTVPTGIKFGTITVLLEYFSFEVTTFRGDGTYSDGRRPDDVVFGVTLAEDLQRRDFTINAMAYHPDFGIIDPFSGEIDLQNKILRTVGEANQRFREDYLRILRGLRFSATLGFQIEAETGEAMHCLWEGLRNVTRERMTAEIRKMVMGNHLELLTNYHSVLEDGIFLGIDCLWEAEDQEHLWEKLEDISKAPPLQSLRLALFLSIFVPDSAILKLSKTEATEVDFLCSETCLAWESEEYFHKMIGKHGRDKMKLLIFFQKYNFPYHRHQLEDMEKSLGVDCCTSLKELNLTGIDLQEVGVQPGEMMGKLLNMALQMVISGKVENEKDELLQVIFGENIIDLDNKIQKNNTE